MRSCVCGFNPLGLVNPAIVAGADGPAGRNHSAALSSPQPSPTGGAATPFRLNQSLSRRSLVHLGTSGTRLPKIAEHDQRQVGLEDRSADVGRHGGRAERRSVQGFQVVFF